MIELDVDVGNTRLKWRLRENLQVLARGAAAHEEARYLPVEWPWPNVARLNVASVAQPELIERLHREASALQGARLFQAQVASRFGRLRNGYLHPEQLGVDRWLAMIAATQGQQQACCVVSCGTAVTIDFVGSSGHHEGGYILPGLNLQYRALLQGTQGVRAAVSNRLSTEPGRTTTDCVRHGVLGALRLALDGLVRTHFQERAFHLVFTGGDAPVLRDAVEWPSELAPDLVLDGLRLLAEAER